MPIIKSAKKALRQTRKRTIINQKRKNLLRQELKTSLKQGNAKSLAAFYALVDKLAKTGVIHHNKARRLKSRLARSLVAKKALAA